MFYRKLSIVLLALFSMMLAACTPEEGLPETGANETQPPVVEGEFESTAGFVSALEAAGATLEAVETENGHLFPVEAQVYQLNGESIQVFEFESLDRQREVAATIARGDTILGTPVPDWPQQPNFWSNGHLIVLYIGEDQATIDLLSRVLGEPLIEARPPSTSEPESEPDGETGGEALPEAVLAAQQRISESLDVPLEEVEVVSMTRLQWRDGCLELGGPDEMCTQVITPGWQVILRVDEREFEARTDELGTQVRWVERDAMKQQPAVFFNG